MEPDKAWQLASKVMWPVALVGCVWIGAKAVENLRMPQASAVVTEVHEGPTVVHELRALARLETLAMHLEKVIDLRQSQSRLYGLVEGEDSLLYVAVGEVSLGVDLSALQEGDVEADRAKGTAVLRLPAPQVLGSRLDEKRSKVHSRSTDWLAKRDEQLERLARQKALQAFELAGAEAASRAQAERNAEQVLTALLRALGYQEIQFIWQAPRAE